MEEETLEGGSKGGGKEELGEEEWVSLNNLSLRKTKIWQDYSILLELKKGEERGGFCCLRMKEIGGLWKFKYVYKHPWTFRPPIYKLTNSSFMSNN